MNQIEIFKSEEFGQIRTVVINDEPYFVGKDVADALGYERADNAIRTHVDEEDKLTHQISASGQNRNMIVINESGLYSLALGSKLPSAKKFKRWITKDVLPTIRKHGMYATDELLENPDLLIKVATALKEEKEKNKKLNEEVNIKNQLIGELKPKADYMDKILKNTGLVTITQIAKDYGMSGKAMNDILHKLKVQYKQSGQWLLYREYQDCGYTHSETIEIERSDGRPDVKMNTKWTQKGRMFLYNLLRTHGYLPIIEQS